MGLGKKPGAGLGFSMDGLFLTGSQLGTEKDTGNGQGEEGAQEEHRRRRGQEALGTVSLSLLPEQGSEQVVVNVCSMNGLMNVQRCPGLEQTFGPGRRGCRGKPADVNWSSDGTKLLGLGRQPPRHLITVS